MALIIYSFYNNIICNPLQMCVCREYLVQILSHLYTLSLCRVQSQCTPFYIYQGIGISFTFYYILFSVTPASSAAVTTQHMAGTQMTSGTATMTPCVKKSTSNRQTRTLRTFCSTKETQWTMANTCLMSMARTLIPVKLTMNLRVI